MAGAKKITRKITRLCGDVFLEANSLSVSRLAIFFSLTLNDLRHKKSVSADLSEQLAGA